MHHERWCEPRRFLPQVHKTSRGQSQLGPQTRIDPARSPHNRACGSASDTSVHFTIMSHPVRRGCDLGDELDCLSGRQLLEFEADQQAVLGFAEPSAITIDNADSVDCELPLRRQFPGCICRKKHVRPRQLESHAIEAEIANATLHGRAVPELRIDGRIDVRALCSSLTGPLEADQDRHGQTDHVVEGPDGSDHQRVKGECAPRQHKCVEQRVDRQRQQHDVGQRDRPAEVELLG